MARRSMASIGQCYRDHPCHGVGQELGTGRRALPGRSEIRVRVQMTANQTSIRASSSGGQAPWAVARPHDSLTRSAWGSLIPGTATSIPEEGQDST